MELGSLWGRNFESRLPWKQPRKARAGVTRDTGRHGLDPVWPRGSAIFPRSDGDPRKNLDPSVGRVAVPAPLKTRNQWQQSNL